MNCERHCCDGMCSDGLKPCPAIDAAPHTTGLLRRLVRGLAAALRWVFTGACV